MIAHFKTHAADAADAADVELESIDTYATMRRLHEPDCGWEAGLNRLVLHGRCPWCADPCFPTLGRDGLTWQCQEGCNP